MLKILVATEVIILAGLIAAMFKEPHLSVAYAAMFLVVSVSLTKLLTSAVKVTAKKKRLEKLLAERDRNALL